MLSQEKTCSTCGNNFPISVFEENFLAKIAPKIKEKTYPLPSPELCPECRLQLRTVHRNEQFLYHTTSALSQKPLVTLYDPQSSWNKDLKIYSYDEWWSESWDGLTYGRDYDFSRGFFEQFDQLRRSVPLVNLMQVDNENSPYTTGTGYCKNCHLINCSENCEDCYYGKLMQKCRDCMDCDYVYESELLYNCFYDKKCYNCVGVSYSQNCTDCYFSENLKGCRNCFLCTNLSNKEYYLMNKPLSPEQWHEGVKKFIGSHENVRKAQEMLAGLRAERIHKYATVLSCENSTGDFLTNCKNCSDCYDVNDSEDCANITVGVNIKDCVDCSNMYLKPELCYQTLGTINTYNVLCSLYIFNSQNIMYSQFCYNSQNLFGCVGLRNKKYCVFNKQYTQEQYEELVSRIVEQMVHHGQWGRYFPAALSPFGYNETVAQEYLPLSKQQALAKGFNWKDKDERDFAPQNYKAPDHINDVSDDVVHETLACEDCGKNYRIIAQELKRLRTMILPLPRRCSDCRHTQRMKLRNGWKLFEKPCTKCGATMQSTFEPQRKEHVYCEKCYLQEVF